MKITRFRIKKAIELVNSRIANAKKANELNVMTFYWAISAATAWFSKGFRFEGDN